MADNLDYSQQLVELLRSILKEPWMDEDDWEDLLQQTLRETKIDLAECNALIQKGVDMGYSAEEQFTALRTYAEAIKEQRKRRNP